MHKHKHKHKNKNKKVQYNTQERGFRGSLQDLF